MLPDSAHDSYLRIYDAQSVSAGYSYSHYFTQLSDIAYRFFSKKSPTEETSRHLWENWINRVGSGGYFSLGDADDNDAVDAENLFYRLATMLYLSVKSKTQRPQVFGYSEYDSKIGLTQSIESQLQRLGALPDPEKVRQFNVSLINDCLSFYLMNYKNNPLLGDREREFYENFFVALFSEICGFRWVSSEMSDVSLKDRLYEAAESLSPEALLGILKKKNAEAVPFADTQWSFYSYFSPKNYLPAWVTGASKPTAAESPKDVLSLVVSDFSRYDASPVTCSPAAIDRALRSIASATLSAEKTFNRQYRVELSDKTEYLEKKLLKELETLICQRKQYWKNQFRWVGLLGRISPVVTGFFSPLPKGIAAVCAVVLGDKNTDEKIRMITGAVHETRARVYPAGQRSDQTQAMYDSLVCRSDIEALQKDPLAYFRWLQISLENLDRWKMHSISGGAMTLIQQNTPTVFVSDVGEAGSDGGVSLNSRRLR